MTLETPNFQEAVCAAVALLFKRFRAEFGLVLYIAAELQDVVQNALNLN